MCAKVVAFEYSEQLHLSCVGSMVASYVPSGSHSDLSPHAHSARAVKHAHTTRCVCVSLCVGGCRYVLGLADRHKDNMLLLGGQVFAHIDFGFVAGDRPWPFDTGPFPIPQLFLQACGQQRWDAFLDDVARAYEIVQARRAALCAVASTLATPLVKAAEPTAAAAETEHTAATATATATSKIDFAAFLEKTLDRSAAEVRALAADGPSNWSTLVKDATYTAGRNAGKVLREAGVPL